jgi:hypothetical protein
VLDLERMEWVIKRQPLLIHMVKGTTTDTCKAFSEARKALIEPYFLILNQENDFEEYYIDKNLKVYKPK